MIQIIEETPSKRPFGHRGYASAEEREEDMRALRARGINYFVCYRDTQAEFAIQYAISDWVTAENQRLYGSPHRTAGYVYVDR